MAMMRSSFVLIMSMIVLSFSLSYGYKFNVGGKDGWAVKPSPWYGHWAENNRFQINDTLYFKYTKGSDSVLVVSKEDYYSCNILNPIQKLDGGDSTFTFDKSGPFFFISGNVENCKKGEKLIIVVLSPNHHRKQGPSSAPSPSWKAPSPAWTPALTPKSNAPSPTLTPTWAPKSNAPSPALTPAWTPKSNAPSPTSKAPSPAWTPAWTPKPNAPSPKSNAPSPSPTSKAPSQTPASTPTSNAPSPALTPTLTPTSNAPSPASNTPSPTSEAPSPTLPPTSTPTSNAPSPTNTPSSDTPSPSATGVESPAPSPAHSSSTRFSGIGVGFVVALIIGSFVI